ncbi:tRNA-aminoacylation cofactor ARC1 [Golovinomyces cichoracearum]|uniref:tRNA-aminoacylation cofactor ARC1 n=1 Tax=Golovinomyces cichoracearum TaxID=62708 RepID=A0A420IFB4_9PEZI|nr:tRNA-aminoacylation cofactor ARC1 [Golovinomyces cichoracearum]
MSSFSGTSYSNTETVEIKKWLTISQDLNSPKGAEQISLLNELNDHLSSRTTLLGEKPSEADVALYRSLAPLVSSWSAEQRTGIEGHPHVVRHLDFVQNSLMFNLSINDEEKIKVDPEDILYVKPPVDAKAEKERLKKEKKALATKQDDESTNIRDQKLQNKTEDTCKKDNQEIKYSKDVIKETISRAVLDKAKPQKKEKVPKTPKPPVAVAPPSVSAIDLRVGHIIKAIKHPEAETLYVSTIAMGDKPGADDTSEYEGQVVRTVCSGLNGLVPLEEMQGRKVVVVCNLKPVKMRGIKSAAMVLAASPRTRDGSDDHSSKVVELVTPPEGAVAGEKVFFEGWKGEPERVLNPKKKIWETFQPGFTTTDNLEVGFKAATIPDLVTEGKNPVGGVARLITENGGVCKVKSLADAVVR